MAKVTITSTAGLRNEVRARHHAWITDEPGSIGGTDGGPSPYELLLAALGACTSMTIRMYAERKGWPVDEIRIELEHERVDGRELITKRIRVVGDLSPEQLERIAYVATRCPVNLTLHRGVEIVDRVELELSTEARR